MKYLAVFLFCLSGIFYHTVYAQQVGDLNPMIAKIDSLASVNSIKNVEVNVFFVTDFLDTTDTRRKCLATENQFRFEGPFLVVEDKYFNLNKLLFFYIEDDELQFFFQGY